MPYMTSELKSRLEELSLIGRVIPREFSALEVDLTIQKWPAYRFMGSMEATRLFLTEYEIAYKEQHKINVDVFEGEQLKIGRKISFRRNNDRLTQVYKARQHADSLGIPYPDYLEFSMDFASRRNGRRYPPQPNQLGPKGNSEHAWWVKFSEFWGHDRKKLAYNRMSPMAQYVVQNRRGLPAQSAVLEDLRNIGAELVSGTSAFIENYVFRFQYLQLNDCDVMGNYHVSVAAKEAKDNIERGWLVPESYPAILPHDLLQSCFGVPGIEQANSMVCHSCPAKAPCQRVRSAMLEQIKSKTGSFDPIAMKKKASQRDRTRKCRALKKLRDAS